MHTMLIYIGFDSNNKVVFVFKEILSKLDFGVYLEITSEHDNLNAINLKQKETSLIECDFTGFEIKNHYNAHLFLKLSNNINKLTCIIYSFFSSVYENKNEYYSLLRNHFTECLSSLKIIKSTFDICIIIIASVILNLPLESKICFNMPGGAGKTFAIDWLGCLFRNKILIMTPTAKAAIHYKLNNVKTIHSTFKLNHQNMSLSSTFYPEPVFIFDEASMISQEVLNSLKIVAKSKLIFLIGDFAQLGPVLAKSIKYLPDLKIINASEDIFLPRFKCTDYVRLLTLIRKRILCENFTPEKTEIEMLIEKFKKETNQQVVRNFLIESEYDYILNTAKIRNLMPNKTLCSHFKSKNFLDIDLNIDTLLPIVSSNNKSVDLMNSELNKQMSDFKNASLLPACFFIKRNNSENKEFMDKLTRHFFNNKLLHIGNCSNEIREGSRILCKQNDSSSLVYNGLSGILVGIERGNFKIVKSIIISKMRNKQQINKKICVYDGDFNLKLFIYDLNLKRIVKMSYKSELILDSFALKTFYIQPNYCVTLHQLQGFTVDSGKIYSYDDVLARNILTNFYVLISRGKNFQDVILSEKIIDRLLDKLFG